MDIVSGLTAARLALDLAKDLREIDRSVDEATFKLKLADLTSALADAKIALSDANLALNEKEQELIDLRRALIDAKMGDICPKCRAGRMQLTKTAGYPYYGLGRLGVEEWYYNCDNAECGFEQTKLHDPHGAVAKQASKR